MRDGEPAEDGASIRRAGGLTHTTDTCLAQGKSWNWDCQRLLNRHLCSKTKETLECPWAWVGRDTPVTDRPTYQSQGN